MTTDNDPLRHHHDYQRVYHHYVSHGQPPERADLLALEYLRANCAPETVLPAAPTEGLASTTETRYETTAPSEQTADSGPGDVSSTSEDGILWEGASQNIGGIGGGRYTLTNHFLYFSRGIVSTNSQQVPLDRIYDVDVKQSLVQKSRGVWTVVVKVNRGRYAEMVNLENIPDGHRVQELINDAARSRRLDNQKHVNTHRYEAIGSGQPAVSNTLIGVSTPATPVDDPISQLERLGKLRDSGVLTEEEFARQKAIILSRMTP